MSAVASRSPQSGRFVSLLLAFLDQCVDGEASVWIACGADGHAGRDLVLALNGLALGGGDVAGEGDEEIAGDALMDGDVGAGVLTAAVC